MATANPVVWGGSDTQVGATRAWVSLILVALCGAYRAFFLTLLAAALLPMLWNWSSFVVRSGSMTPALAVGDVAVAKPFSTSGPVPVGGVMIFENPARPEVHQLLIHRVVEYLGNDQYVTAGDANTDVDATPTLRRNFRAQAVIAVPYVGLPLVWLWTDNFGLLGGWMLLTIAAFTHASLRGIDSHTPGRPKGRRVRQIRRSLPFFAVGLAVAGGLGGVVSLGSGAEPASAGFTATTANGSNLWTVGQIVAKYSAAVHADNPFVYYQVDEASGSSAADSSGNNRAGTYTAIGSYRQTGALTNSSTYAVGLGGLTGRVVSGGSSISNPANFSLELWFKTTTTTGGKLIGFESTRNASSLTYDRHVFMRPDGKLVYGGWPSVQIRLLTSPAAYNNGSWHHLVLTTAPNGQQETATMYVDGSQVATGTTTRTSLYSGWWRVGYGSLPVGSGYPTTAGFAGSIDQVAVYQSRLSASRVAAHWAAR